MVRLVMFPGSHANKETTSATARDDPYYQFLENVLTTARTFGFALPQNLNTTVDRVYQQTHRTSHVARMMRTTR